MSKILAPELVWLPDGFRTGYQVEVLDDGTIGRVGPSLGRATETLAHEALLPGMVNAHSHAFQRALRGRAERFPREPGSFWSWREEMYRLVAEMHRELFHRTTRACFREMLRSGITTVGEFHYLHHLSASSDYALDEAVLDAAGMAGIRLVLLDVCYMTGDVEKPLEGPQKRFGSETVDEFLLSVERLEKRVDRKRQHLGISAHSIRAVPLEAVVELHDWARRRSRPFHMHVEEQLREIEASMAHYGRRPLDLLLEHLDLGSEFSAVHATHSDETGLAALKSSGANVVLCPLTEANLADGTAPPGVTEPGHHLGLGSDSNLRIDFTEEMRLLEYGQRLRSERRGAFTNKDGRVAHRLFHIATEGGARALAVKAGRIATGYAADFFTIDARGELDGEGGVELSPDDRLTAFVLGDGARAIKRVAVAGKWVV